jgi:heat shock protein HslJ
LPSADQYTNEFPVDGQVHIKPYYNRLGGTFAVSGSSLVVKEGSSTLAA